MKPLKGNPTLRLLRLVLRRFNRLELLIQNNSRPLPDDLIDTPAVRMLTRMSDRTLSRRRSDARRQNLLQQIARSRSPPE